MHACAQRFLFAVVNLCSWSLVTLQVTALYATACVLHTEEEKGLQLQGLSCRLLSHSPKAQASVSCKNYVHLAAATQSFIACQQRDNTIMTD